LVPFDAMQHTQTPLVECIDLPTVGGGYVISRVCLFVRLLTGLLQKSSAILI